ncbi:MAG: 3-phosphoserine/phosphohydroxythreonine transaminase [Chloroflexi bacterium]|nr:MAG: 3-phosphoserine/phosphohydroxythreonine transaminase [Chloroflexota bacterium]
MPPPSRTMNFNAGPAALPLAVLEACRDELVDFGNTGMSIMEHSHRGAAYEAVHHDAIARLRSLMSIPDGTGAGGYDILFMQGGASQQFAQVAMNLLSPGASAGYIVSGVWGEKAVSEARAVASESGATVHVACTTASTTPGGAKYVRVPDADEVALAPTDAYLHLTTNETIDGVQYATAPGAMFPSFGTVPVVGDMSSDIAWRPIDVRQFGLIYAGAQKNLGPSGVTVVIIRRDLVEAGRTDIPVIFQYRTTSRHTSLYNTPPTFSIYLMRQVLAWIGSLGGLEAVEARNRAKSGAIYRVIDAFPEFYRCPVAVDSRSMMNIVFRLPTPALEEAFVASTEAHGMVGLRGHRSVGGIRASLYNAVEPAWVDALAQLMHHTATRHA